MTINTTKIKEVAVTVDDHKKRIMQIGFAVLGILLSCYIFFVAKIVFDVVGRRTAENSIRAHSSKISALEATYLAKTNSLDLYAAQNLGLEETHHVLYASRTTTASTVGMR